MDGTCPDCLAAAATRAASEKNDQQVRGTDRGHVLGVDFTGPHPVTVDGNVWHLGVTEAATGVKFSHALPEKTAANTRDALAKVVIELKKMCPDKDVVRIHSDQDPAMKGEVSKWILENTWEQTDTGGYSCNANAIQERANRKLHEQVRAMLRTGAGHSTQYREVWDVLMRHAAFVILTTCQKRAVKRLLSVWVHLRWMC